MRVGIIGLGLIGGSMAIDLKRKGFASEVLGVEAEPVNAAAAEKIGLVDRVAGFHDCVESSDVVILAVPVGAAVRMLPQVHCRTVLVQLVKEVENMDHLQKTQLMEITKLL